MSNPSVTTSEPYSRLEIELEFVQCLANPYYLNFLAQEKYFSDPSFLAYLNYLEYFRQPEYTKLLTYPKHSLNALSLLKEQSFRSDIIQPQVAKQLFDDGVAGVTALTARNRDIMGDKVGTGDGQEASGSGSAEVEGREVERQNGGASSGGNR